MSIPHPILNDQEFWTRLEFVSSDWLQQSTDEVLRRFWIDGFIPEANSNTRLGTEVTGVAWVAEGPRNQTAFQFVVEVPQKLLHRPERPFLIRCLSLDAMEKIIRIELSSGEQDIRNGPKKE